MKLASLLAFVIVFASTATAQTPDAAYLIGPKDLLEVNVLETPQVNGQWRVADDGTISLPLLGEVSVQGLTAPQVRTRIESLLTASFVNRANVTVVIREYANKPISVLGAVVNPGSLNVSGRMNLLQVITAAGGLKDTAGPTIYVLRSDDNGLSDTLEIRVEDLLRNAPGRWNIPIFPSDVVNIPVVTTVTVFAMGAVQKPGAIDFSSDDRMTLLTLIARAGGLTDRASHSITIKRRGPDGGDVETVVDYGRIVSGRIPDVRIEANDVIIVKESFF